MNTRSKNTIIFAGLALLVTGAVLYAGPLDPPPGPISSTGKTLIEIEPRIAINATNTPGDASSLFTITQPGSYYLTGNLTGVAGRVGIWVNAPNVTIDLAGFQMLGVPGASVGIFVNGTGIRVHSGTMMDWPAGATNRGGSGSRVHVHDIAFRNNATDAGAYTVNAFSGVLMERCRFDLTPRGVVASDGLIRDCIMGLTSGGTGFQLLGQVTLERCTVTGGTDAFVVVSGKRHGFVDCVSNFAFRGFNAGDQAVLERCRVDGAGGDAITVGASSIVSGCSVVGSAGGAGRGIVTTASGSTIRECAVSNMAGPGYQLADASRAEACTASSCAGAGFIAGSRVQLSGCGATANFSHGISAGDGCSIIECSATDNALRGISANNGCLIRNCHTRNNQTDGIAVNFSCTVADSNSNGDGAAAGEQGGIRVFGQANRIENNNVTFADRGFLIDAGGNFIARNTVSGCTVNWSVVANNKCLVVLGTNSAAISGNSGGVPPGSTDPYANFTY